jgi:hypothetical protein
VRPENGSEHRPQGDGLFALVLFVPGAGGGPPLSYGVAVTRAMVNAATAAGFIEGENVAIEYRYADLFGWCARRLRRRSRPTPLDERRC